MPCLYVVHVVQCVCTERDALVVGDVAHTIGVDSFSSSDIAGQAFEQTIVQMETRITRGGCILPLRGLVLWASALSGVVRVGLELRCMSFALLVFLSVLCKHQGTSSHRGRVRPNDVFGYATRYRRSVTKYNTHGCYHNFCSFSTD